MGYKYSVSYAPTGRAQCRFCGKLIKQDALRITRESGPIEHFGGDAGITNHFHFKHAFDAMKRGRCTSKIVTSTNILKGFSGLLDKDKKSIQKELSKFNKQWDKKCSGKMKASGSKKSSRKNSRKLRSSRKRRSNRRSRRKSLH